MPYLLGSFTDSVNIINAQIMGYQSIMIRYFIQNSIYMYDTIIVNALIIGGIVELTKYESSTHSFVASVKFEENSIKLANLTINGWSIWRIDIIGII